MTVLRVVVADDHAVVRAGLCALLGQTDDLQVVGEAADGAARRRAWCRSCGPTWC